MKYNYTYATYDIINDKYYIGSHHHNYLPNRYLGSGKELLRAVKKYGRNNFKKIILKMFNTREEASAYELVIQRANNVVESERYYNLKYDGVTHTAGSNAKRGSPGSKNGMYGKTHSKETRDKISKANKGVSTQPASEERKQKVRNALIGKEQPLIVCPHCFTAGGKSIMKRWHFDNCKHKIKS